LFFLRDWKKFKCTTRSRRDKILKSRDYFFYFVQKFTYKFLLWIFTGVSNPGERKPETKNRRNPDERKLEQVSFPLKKE
jgi:hypothetical protein